MKPLSHQTRDAIREIIEREGINHREFAERVGVSHRHVFKWVRETGPQTPNANTLERIAKVFGLEIKFELFSL